MRKNIFRQFVAVFLVVAMPLVWGCAATKPLPQPRRVVDPASVDGASRSERWDLAAVEYENLGQGMDYSKANLEPVFLVFHNKTDLRPVVSVDEARGVAADGSEYLGGGGGGGAYSRDEAVRLVFDSETFSVTASNAAKTGALGAVLGAGLGALIGAIGGGDNIWKGAAIGGGVGAAAGAAVSLPDAERDLKRTIRNELDRYAWTDDAVPARYTKVGYVYLPGGKGIEITELKVLVRVGDEIETVVLPVVPHAAKAAK